MSTFAWDWSFALACLPELLAGLKLTVIATLFGSLIAAAVGLVMCLLKIARIPIVSPMMSFLIQLVRGTPLLIQLYLVFYVAPTWGLTFPAPALARAYPIGGFGFIDLYTCYASAAVRDAMAGTTAGNLGLLRWFFGSSAENSSQVKTELNRNGFSALPGSWAGAVKKLLVTDQKTRIGIPGQVKTGCAAVSGGA